MAGGERKNKIDSREGYSLWHGGFSRHGSRGARPRPNAARRAPGKKTWAGGARRRRPGCLGCDVVSQYEGPVLAEAWRVVRRKGATALGRAAPAPRALVATAAFGAWTACRCWRRKRPLPARCGAAAAAAAHRHRRTRACARAHPARAAACAAPAAACVARQGTRWRRLAPAAGSAAWRGRPAAARKGGGVQAALNAHCRIASGGGTAEAGGGRHPGSPSAWRAAPACRLIG